MQIAVIPIIVALILLALVWWVASQLVTDQFILKIIRIVIVVLVVLWIVSAIGGFSPTIVIR